MPRTSTVWWVGNCNAPQRALTFFATEPELSLDDQVTHWAKATQQGSEIAQAHMPRAITNQLALADDERPASPRLPAYFHHDLMFLAGHAISIVRSRDLGEAQVSPVIAYENDGTRIDEHVAVLFPRNARRFLDKDASRFPGLDPFLMKLPRIAADPDFGDDDIALSPDALDPPADIWVDPGFIRTFFMTDRLATALRDGGVDGAFDLRRARIST